MITQNYKCTPYCTIHSINKIVGNYLERKTDSEILIHLPQSDFENTSIYNGYLMCTYKYLWNLSC